MAADAEQKRLAAAEAERQRRAVEAAERTRRVAEEARRKAVGLAFWNAVKDSPNPADYDAYLQHYPDGEFADLARGRMAEIERAALAAAAQREREAAEASARAEAVRLAAEEAARIAAEAKTADVALWRSVQDSPDASDFATYLREFPDGEFAALARARKDDIERRALAAAAESEAAERRAAEDAARKQAEQRAMERALWEAVAASPSAADYQIYLQQYPDGIYAALAQTRLAEAEEAERRSAEETKRKVAEEANRKENARVADEKARAKDEAAEVETTLVVPTLESFGGSWTAYDNGFTIEVKIHGSSLEGRIDHSVTSVKATPRLRFDGKIESDGRVDLWVRGRGWNIRKLTGTMPHLKLSTGGGVQVVQTLP